MRAEELIEQQPLRGRTVLVTRPGHLADNLIQAIAAQGGRALHLPTVDIEFQSEIPGIRQVFDGAQPHDIGVFVSVNAVHSVSNWLVANNLHWPPAMKCMAVGPTTAKAAETAFSLDHVTAPASKFGAESLLEMEVLQQTSDSSIALFVGADGSPLLQTEFPKRGFTVSELIVYRRVIPEINPDSVAESLKESGVDYVVITSITGADHLFEMLGSEFAQQIKSARFVTYSERIANHLTKIGIKHTHVADEASDSSVIETIISNLPHL